MGCDHKKPVQFLTLNRLLWTGCLLMALTGCQRNSAPTRYGVSGTITLDGAPVETGSITFNPDENTRSPNAGSVITQGAYSIPPETGLVDGIYHVKISWDRKTGKQIPGSAPLPPGTMVDETAEAIPEKYNSLEAVIYPQKNVVDFKLDSK